MTISVARAGSMLPGFGASLLGLQPGGGVPTARGVLLADLRTGRQVTHVPAVGGAWRASEGIAGTASADPALATAHPVTNPTVAPRPFAVSAAVPAGDKRAMSIAKQGARRTKGSSPWRFPV